MKNRISYVTNFSKEYKTSDDVFKLSPEEIKTLISSIIDVKVKFTHANFYGSTQTVKVWVSSLECNEYSCTVTLKSSPRIPDSHFPTVGSLLKHLNKPFPISVQILG